MARYYVGDQDQIPYPIRIIYPPTPSLSQHFALSEK